MSEFIRSRGADVARALREVGENARLLYAETQVEDAWNKIGGTDGHEVTPSHVRRVLQAELSYMNARVARVGEENLDNPERLALLKKAQRLRSIEGREAAGRFFSQQMVEFREDRKRIDAIRSSAHISYTHERAVATFTQADRQVRELERRLTACRVALSFIASQA